MSVGALLDMAGRYLAEATDAISQERRPTPYDTYGCFTARDLVWQELARLADLAGVARPDQTQSRDDMLTQLDQFAAVSHVDGSQAAMVVATVLEVARIGQVHTDFGMQTRHGHAASRVGLAATAIGLAAETVATHVVPREPLFDPSPAMRRGRVRRHGPMPPGAIRSLWRAGVYRSDELMHVVRGVQREQVLGEFARLAVTALDVDAALLGWQPHWINGEWAHLRRLSDSPARPLLLRVGRAPPSDLLRGLDVITVHTRPNGPNEVTSFGQLNEAITAAALTVRDSPGAATVGMAGQAARLGFALTAAASRLNGETAGLTVTTRWHGNVWKQLATAANAVNDLRDSSESTIRSELDHAATWLRQQLRDNSSLHGLEPHHVIKAEGDLRRLCHELLGPIRRAAERHQLLIPGGATLDRTVGAVRVSSVVWQPAVRDDPAIQVLCQALTVAASLQPTCRQLNTGEKAVLGLTAAFPSHTATALPLATVVDNRPAAAEQRQPNAPTVQR